jgi:hypothetical protein
MPPLVSWLARVLPSMTLFSLLLYTSLLLSASAQSTSAPASNSTISANVTVIRETSSITSTSLSSTGSQTLAIVTVIPTVYNVTLTIAPPTSTASSSANASASATHTPSPTVLATKIDPAFGVLGSVLILTGLPSAFLGHKNRWSVHTLAVHRQLSLSVLGRPSF